MNDTGDENVSGWSAVTAEWKSSFSQCSACGDWPAVTSVPILLCVTLNNAVLKPNTVVEVLSTWGHCSMCSLTWPTLWVAAFISPALPRNRDQIFSRATTEACFCYMEFTFSSHAETKKINKTKKMPVFTMAPKDRESSAESLPAEPAFVCFIGCKIQDRSVLPQGQRDTCTLSSK